MLEQQHSQQLRQVGFTQTNRWLQIRYFVGNLDGWHPQISSWRSTISPDHIRAQIELESGQLVVCDIDTPCGVVPQFSSLRSATDPGWFEFRFLKPRDARL